MSADGGSGVDEQVAGTGLVERGHVIGEIGDLELGITGRVDASFLTLIEPVYGTALRIGIRDQDRAIASLLGGDGQVHGRGGFAGAAFLIGNDDGFHERENGRFLVFMKAGNEEASTVGEEILPAVAFLHRLRLRCSVYIRRGNLNTLDYGHVAEGGV